MIVFRALAFAFDCCSTFIVCEFAFELLTLSLRVRAIRLVLTMSAPTRRLRVKTKMLKPNQVPLVTVDDWEAEEKAGSRRQVYLVTFTHPKQSHSAYGKRLVAPGSMTKEKVLERGNIKASTI